MADFFEVLDERNSVRAYQAEPLTEEQLRLIAEAGLKAPTAVNRQEVHISVVGSDHPVVAEIQNELNPGAEKSFYYGAPVIFLLSGRDDFSWSTFDAGIAVENMHLAAKALGLGSVIVGCIDRVLLGGRKAYYNEKLGIPDGYSFKIALPVGHPAAEKVPHAIDAASHVSVVE